MELKFATPVLLCLCMAVPALADQVINDDLIVTRDLCVGASTCVDGEVFNGEDIKIRSTNPELYLFDTSTSATNLWSLKGDDDSAGGFDSFSINNRSGGTIPFAIARSAPSASMFISDAGQIGLGTTLPGSELHIFSNSIPGLRLEVGGGVPYVWEIGADHSAIAIQDITTGSSPLIIQDGASTGDIYLQGDGDLGLGTTAPESALHVRRTGDSAKILVEGASGDAADMFQMKNNGGSYFTLTNTASGRDWFFTHENNVSGRFIITSSTNPSQGMFLSPTGNLSIGGTLTTAGSCSVGCDRVFDADYDLPDMQEHHAEMWAKGYLPNVGPTPENGSINVSDKLGRMLNELEHAHIYIGQLHEEIAHLKTAQAEKDAMRDTRINALLARLDKLEAPQ